MSWRAFPALKDLLQRLLGIYDMQSAGPAPVKSLLKIILLASQTLQKHCAETLRRLLELATK